MENLSSHFSAQVDRSFIHFCRQSTISCIPYRYVDLCTW